MEKIEKEFLDKYKGKIKNYDIKIENNHISTIKISEGNEGIYESGDLKKLKNLKKVDIAKSGIKKLEPEYLPESLKVLRVSKDQDVSEIEKDPRFKKLRIEKY
ncbi:MAG: hypothetical protein QW199_01860 [Candidatus Pacearchaeota archaeon]